jgi:hypothetical protein
LINIGVNTQKTFFGEIKMATRTLKLMGKAYSEESNSVNLVVHFNGNEVFNGSMPATLVDDIDLETEVTHENVVEVCSFSGPDASAESQSYPFSIAVTGGDFVFQNFVGNYTGFEATWNEDGTLNTVVTAPADYFGELNHNTAESDGTTNIVFASGKAPDIYDPSQNTGNWCRLIEDTDTMSADFNISILIDQPFATKPSWWDGPEQ